MGGWQLPTCLPLLKPVYFLQIDQEDRLVSIVMMYACRGIPFTEVQLCKLTYQIAVAEKKIGFSPTKKRAGRSWLNYFYKKQPDLKKKVASNLLIGRAMAANPGCIEKFFEDYSGWLKEWKLEYSPISIWNVDECRIGDVPQMEKVIGVKGEQSFQTVSGKKATNTTMLTFVSAGGLSLNPMLIFKASKIKTEWRGAAPSGYMLQPSVTGYINAKLFNEYGEYFIKFLKEYHILTGNKKVLLLLDMHKSHLFNLDFMEYMKANNVEVCSFSPHCTHVLQPLDDVPFACFKNEYKKELLIMNRQLCGNCMNKTQFFRVFIPAYIQGLTPEAIRKGYKNTGIYPLNPQAEKLKNIQASAVYDRCKCTLWLLGRC